MPDEQRLLELIANSRQGILAAVTRAGYPHLTNVLYVWDPVERIARVSTTADRVKGRILQRDHHASLHVAGPHFWSYAVAEGAAETSEVATTPGDDACRELFAVHSAFTAGRMRRRSSGRWWMPGGWSFDFGSEGSTACWRSRRAAEELRASALRDRHGGAPGAHAPR